jgi:hypothetical protein
LSAEIIKQLTERGYKVRGTVRNVKNAVTFCSTSDFFQEKVAHLHDLFPNLKLYEADLLQDGSFDEAVKGIHFFVD